MAPQLATDLVELYDDSMPGIIEAQACHSLPDDILAMLVAQPAADGTDTAAKNDQWKVLAGELTDEVGIYVHAVDSLFGKVINLFRDNRESGHFVALMTTELTTRDFYKPAIDSQICNYVTGCKKCQQLEPHRHGCIKDQHWHRDTITARVSHLD